MYFAKSSFVTALGKLLTHSAVIRLAKWQRQPVMQVYDCYLCANCMETEVSYSHNAWNNFTFPGDL